jgi:hypothetical protein
MHASIRTGVSVLLSCLCCAGLAACTAAASSGPDVTVTDPSVGKPAPPVSVQAALSHMAFTPYAALGQSNDDGLAPDESVNALGTACMSDAGYPSENPPSALSISSAGLSFAQDYGSWGYLGLADAQQYGFLQPPGAAMVSLGISPTGQNPAALPAAEQAALGKCQTIVGDFGAEVSDGPLAGIATITSDISNDVNADGQIRSAATAWSACMAREGFNYPDPGTASADELRSIASSEGTGGTGGKLIIGGTSLSTAEDQAQIAMAVADADCTQSTDLAGIYFAVQASYEQQLVDANQQALGTAVQQFRADYQKEVGKLPALFKTAKAVPFPHGVNVVRRR